MCLNFKNVALNYLLSSIIFLLDVCNGTCKSYEAYILSPLFFYHIFCTFDIFIIQFLILLLINLLYHM